MFVHIFKQQSWHMHFNLTICIETIWCKNSSDFAFASPRPPPSPLKQCCDNDNMPPGLFKGSSQHFLWEGGEIVNKKLKYMSKNRSKLEKHNALNTKVSIFLHLNIGAQYLCCSLISFTSIVHL